MELLIKNGRIVDWSQDFNGDIYINNGRIVEIGENLDKSCSTIDAKGSIVLPSFLDLHSHFREPGFTNKEDIYSGSRAAVRGGYTMVNLMANTDPVCSDMDTINYVLDKVKEVGLIDAHQVASITNNLAGDDLTHLDKLDSKVKMISDDGRDIMNSKVMLEAMVKAGKSGRIVICHSEEHSLTSVDTRLAENTMAWRNITLAQFTGCAVHMAHVSTKETMEYIIQAKNKGHNLSCEVTPHHIALVDSDYSVNPPIRTESDVDFLIKSIKEGWVDAIATDHAPHTIEDKKRGAPGISGIETAFAVCYTSLVKKGHITLSKLSELMSRNPAYIMGVNKGQIKIGYDGDIVLVDTDKGYTICSSEFKSKGKNTPFDGASVYGRIKKTIKGGKVVFSQE
ncbi:dihydroorotase [Clostridium sp. CX1]|uniref:dihydroorotase n=1 Tax=Clostridium sp. CX1 TaxID=2978346 RepID=UPI0021C16EAA|nr:dihydroorotase [Clostridium sp. CX1]MCT8978204.1 dihydroorotase [Clostridium sp. CX1]